MAEQNGVHLKLVAQCNVNFKSYMQLYAAVSVAQSYVHYFTRISAADIGRPSVKDRPLLFHTTHNDNIEISADRRRARRVSTFCKGICFSARIISPNEPVHVRITDISALWSGAVRLGFTSYDPASIDATTLPRYACPDLTNKPGYWAKAVPEKLVGRNHVITFFFSRNGDVVYGINGEDKGMFFNGVDTSRMLWALLDIYGNTTAVEFIDNLVLNSLPILSAGSPPVTHIDVLSPSVPDSITVPNSSTAVDSVTNSSTPKLLEKLSPMSAVSEVTPDQPVVIRWSNLPPLSPFSFHPSIAGRNAFVNQDGTIAVRRANEYCNAYVFTHVPCKPGDALCLAVLSIDASFGGSLAFGMTCCDPTTLRPDLLPDDSDLLLDRPEYWVVNKDVCGGPEPGDQLMFQLTKHGEIHYGRNGHHISTLMYVDTSLPLWAFFDIYGSVQKIKLLGVVHGSSTVLTESPAPRVQPVTLPRTRASSPSGSSGSMSACQTSTLPPPRPPPPRLPVAKPRQTSPPPALPPKDHFGSSLPSGTNNVEKLSTSPVSSETEVPPPLPFPRLRHSDDGNLSPTGSFRADSLNPWPCQIARRARHSTGMTHAERLARKSVPPAPLPLLSAKLPKSSDSPCQEVVQPADAATGISATDKLRVGENVSFSTVDDARAELGGSTAECSVCYERPSDCVLYTCGHMCMCYGCAVGLQRVNAGCPICRQDIKDVIKIYRS